ncbi:MAG: sodium-translocating pyrophosphatase [Sphingobacteriia bacterium 24-36-13]|jgi:K(+)-stimulated pyrophosphate-energized sodium pump|uniref:sodium-translocating pyrophosphatase n=1 Tax=Sediminibacterium sp. TaxID=1917865 RepID=UPI000BDD7F6F|nr:sodium-translocating pyrophosphatase [Sediminibacterium sp.]OYY11044.1 MAG: sodium-translocating pyrophosphatase [Sphingobacteriia bacterium 35-36-14]OYZ54697.1 MAG: sodium-translocating pyrophosphatase [Sphingobacteriia bacterium 24-36-13]OZA63437.1 MAG: sodium-translocating pyrophosphatase [Sphingobacteriia bacterium 39-36-14]HQS23390.1 sodium-translocating pyrophosphatase [Sediminibacterium sp.]HQS34849.1 sodium-translocating pyrophosphatase [Sediminibacterium sp.]
MNNLLFYAVPAMGVIGLLYTLIKFNWVSKQDAGNARMKEISTYIAEGAMAFLKAEWKILAYFVVIVAILLGFMAQSNEDSHWSIAISFFIGAVFSATAGYIGMKVATKANVRTAEAARTSLSKALNVSFTGGAVMGLGVSGLAVLGLGGLFLVLKQYFSPDGDVEGMLRTIEVLTGFSLGAESIALFARVGGGIYTKAADVGADLVGKVEAGIPEDDPRNPATIADNVGDNVGDVAGMGADLFGSYVATVLATMVLGNEVTAADGSRLIDAFGGLSPILLPMLIAGIGIILSIIGTLFVRIGENAGLNTAVVQKALNMGNYGSMVLTAIVCYFLVGNVLPETMTLRGAEFTRNGVYGAIVVGLVVGTLMSIITEYYTAMGKRPVMSIIRQSATGHATNIIGGLAIGMESTFLPILVLAGGIYGSFLCAGLYGVAIAAAGMMATTGMQLAIDAFGPIADNAGGIAEMSELPGEVREKTDILDAVGNTTAASGKGFAIASAALTALALFAAFVGVAMPNNQHIDIYKADVLAALFIGGMIPFIFSSLAIRAVGEAAMAMVEEVRRQFRTIPGIMEGTGKPEYDKCVAISTEASLKKMMLPGAITIISPILIGFLLGPEALGGFLAGATVSGVLMGIFQNNAGGAWDNAKKSFEKGVEINGEMYYKKSEPHKASVTGDTVGDPFKDTSGPSMNILIKLMSIVSLVIAPTLAHLHPTGAAENKIEKKIEIRVTGQDTAAMSMSAQPNADGLTGLIEALKTDGVIESAENVSIKIEAGKLLINGTAVTDDVYKKYEQFYMSMSDKGIEIKASEIKK